jgi:hypothetical protein
MDNRKIPAPIKPIIALDELSEGMLFDIGYANGLTPALDVPERDIPNGSRAG